jgi:hypothetical protein
MHTIDSKTILILPLAKTRVAVANLARIGALKAKAN